MSHSEYSLPNKPYNIKKKWQLLNKSHKRCIRLAHTFCLNKAAGMEVLNFQALNILIKMSIQFIANLV
jgi:hypothetical protein